MAVPSMIRPQPKEGRLVLHGTAYRALVLQVFELDGWKCKICRKRRALTPHHMLKRSRLRVDSVDNLLSVCLFCHTAIDSRDIDVRWVDTATRTIEVSRRTA